MENTSPLSCFGGLGVGQLSAGGDHLFNGDRAIGKVPNGMHVLQGHALIGHLTDAPNRYIQVCGKCGVPTPLSVQPCLDLHGLSLGERKPTGQGFSKPPVATMRRTMNEVRKHWLWNLLNKTFKGDRPKLIKAAGLTKGRLSQMLAGGFGDTATKRLIARLRENEVFLPDDYFDRPIPYEGQETLSDEAMEIARQYEKMEEAERKRFKWLMVFTRNGVDPTQIPPAPPLASPTSSKSKK